MAIVTVSTSNTFNEWRVVTNQLVTEVNKTESGTAVLVANTITANTITANSDVTVSGNTSITGTLGVTGNVTLAGELRGPSTFTIDPAAVGDNTGTVVIKGNLQVDGSTTTINSTTLTIDDKNIVVASGAADNAAADGAGLVVDGSNASITYIASGDKFNINKALELTSTLSISGNTNIDSGTLFVDVFNNRVGINTTDTTNGTLNIVGPATANAYTLFVSNVDGTYNPYIRLYHDSNGVKVIQSSTYGGSSSHLQFEIGGVHALSLKPGETIFNESGADQDFRVESDTNTHALFIDAANSRIGINKANLSGGAGVQEILGILQMRVGGNATALLLDTGVDYAGLKINSGAGNASGSVDSWEIAYRPSYSAGVASAGDVSAFKINSPYGGQNEIVINEDGSDIDFRVESDTNTSAFFIDGATGYVGIGTTVPARILTLKGTNSSIQLTDSVAGNDVQAGGLIQYQTTNQQLAIRNYDTASGNGAISFQTGGAYEKMRITNTGRVGIGITDPLTTTHIVTGSANGLVIDPTYYGGGGGESALANSANTVYNLTLRSAYGVNAAGASNGGHKWGILLTGYNGSSVGAGQLAKSAGLFAVSEETEGGYNRKVGMSLWTSPFDDAIAERVRITNDGKVGIGTTNPAGKLSSVVTTAGDSSLTLERSGSSRFEFIQGIVAVTGDSLKIRDTTLSQDYLMFRSGRVGFGNVPNPAYSIDVADTAGGNMIRFTRSGSEMGGFISGAIGFFGSLSNHSFVLMTNSTARINILSSGEVGIGNTNPGQVLSIAGATDGKGLGFGGATNNYGNIFGSYSSGDMMIATGLQGNTTVEGVTSSFGDGSMYRSAIRLSAFGGRGIEFFTNTNSTVARGTAITPNARMKIATDGKVGIGTTDPGYLLTMRGGSGTGFQMENSDDEGRGFRILITGSATRGVALNSTSSLYPLTFGIDSVEKMRLSTSGYFGIGTTAPNSILHVSKSVDNGPGTATRISTGFGAGRVVLHNQDEVGTGNKMGLVFAHAGDPGVAAVIGSYKESGNWRTGLQFYTNGQTGGDVDGITERMRLTADGKLGIGTTDPLATLSVTGDLYYTGTLIEPGGYRTLNFPTEQRGATISRLEICQISRDFNDWSNAYLEIIVRHRNYHSGGYSKYIISYGYFLGAVVSCLAAEGRSPGRVYAGTEVTVAGDVRYTPIYLDIPTYFEFDVQAIYNTTEIAVGTAFSGSGQIKFTKTYSDGSGSGNLNFYQMTGLISGGTAIGTTAPATYGAGDNKLVVAGGSGGTYVDSAGTTLVIDGNGTNTPITLYARYSNDFKIQSDSFITLRTGGSPVERVRITSDGNVGIGTTNPTYGLHVTTTTNLEAARNIYVPHSGVSGGYGAASTNKIHVGSYMDLQHFSYTNSPAFLFNASIKRSDFVGSGSGTGSSFNVIEPYFSGGNYALISTVNGGISFNIGAWGGNSEIDLGDISNHSSYKGGHDGNSFVIRSTGANGLNMRPDAGDSNNSARAFFVNSGTTWAIMNNSGNLSFRSGATVGSDSGTQRVYFDTSGNVVIGGVLTENSSIALKENVNPISNALDYISQLVGVTYDRKDGSAKNRAGLIKEEVEKVLPNVVNDNGIQYTNIIAYLVESIKDLKKEIDDLKKK